MPIIDIVSHNLHEHQSVIASIESSIGVQIREVACLIAGSLSSGSTLFWCGNGGSAADSQHLAAELVGRFKKNRRALRSIALTTDASVLTSVANDYSYYDVFSRQIEALAREGDVLVAISTSGQSKNVVRAIQVANQLGIKTIALLGKSGGLAKSLADFVLVVPSESTARIQEAHILIGHILCDLIEQELGLA
jgi:D-sedoheptulose 7-phosphate isomerase